MTVFHHIDNEEAAGPARPAGQWTAFDQSGGSTAFCYPEAAFPQRGRLGLRVDVPVASPAFARKSLAMVLPPGGDLYAGFWINIRRLRPVLPYPYGSDCCSLYQGGSFQTVLAVGYDGRLFAWQRGDNGIVEPPWTSIALGVNEWHYVVLQVRRSPSADVFGGLVRIYIDGREARVQTGIDNYDRLALPITDIRLGSALWPNANAYDIDEIKIADVYPQPHVPAASSDLLEPARVAILYSAVSARSRQVADYFAEKLGVCPVNLIALPAASPAETVGSYAQFQDQVERPVEEYFARNPALAQQCACFLLACDVPGYFTDGGRRISAVSRMMGFGRPYAGPRPNPLHGHRERLTIWQLRQAQMYLAARIDAASPESCMAMVDRSMAASALTLPPGGAICGDDPAYIASLDCQRLRVARRVVTAGEALGEASVAFGSGLSAATAGGRAMWVELLAAGGASLRSASALTAALEHWAAAVGFASDAGAFDIAAFIEMLRVGGTLAEAAAVASAQLDDGLVVAGNPLMTLRFPRAGTDIYHAVGAIENVDWGRPAAQLAAGETTCQLSLTADPGQRHVVAARSVSPAGVQECGTHTLCVLQADEQGRLGVALDAVTDLTAMRLSEGSYAGGSPPSQPAAIGLAFSYEPSPGHATADGFDVLSDHGSGTLDLAAPVRTLSARPGQRDYRATIAVDLAAGVAIKLAVRPRCGDLLGPPGDVVEVGLADVPPPTGQVWMI